MLKISKIIILVIFFLKLSTASANTVCAPQTLLQHPHDILGCYIAKKDAIAPPVLRTVGSSRDTTHHVTIDTYLFTSQIWRGNPWQHTLVIYRPDHIQSHQALLLVNGGTRYRQAKDNPSPAKLEFARIAQETQTIVIDLQDVPNQYLLSKDHIPRKEDSTMAYSWNRFMDDPLHNQDWPLLLPMTKAVVRSMDATQAILHAKNIHVDYFVIAGASKRGWTTWLSAIADTRVNAIVPIVIDILNSQKTILHIYSFYNNNWPMPAFHDYVEQGVPNRLTSSAFMKLMQIQDPFSYLPDPTDRKRLSIPKYIISAGRDDFFVPDSLNLYLNQLPGETHIRIFPEEGHYIDLKNSVQPALLSFYRMIVNHEKRPVLKWMINAKGELTGIITNIKPEKIELIETINPAVRDFRKFSAKNVTYQIKEIDNTCINYSCSYPITIAAPAKGWKIAIVQVTFKKLDGEFLIFTTPNFIKEA